MPGPRRAMPSTTSPGTRSVVPRASTTSSLSGGPPNDVLPLAEGRFPRALAPAADRLVTIGPLPGQRDLTIEILDFSGRVIARHVTDSGRQPIALLGRWRDPHLRGHRCRRHHARPADRGRRPHRPHRRRELRLTGAWTADSRAVIATGVVDGVSAVRILPLDGGAPRVVKVPADEPRAQFSGASATHATYRVQVGDDRNHNRIFALDLATGERTLLTEGRTSPPGGPTRRIPLQGAGRRPSPLEVRRAGPADAHLLQRTRGLRGRTTLRLPRRSRGLYRAGRRFRGRHDRGLSRRRTALTGHARRPRPTRRMLPPLGTQFLPRRPVDRCLPPGLAQRRHRHADPRAGGGPCHRGAQCEPRRRVLVRCHNGRPTAAASPSSPGTATEAWVAFAPTAPGERVRHLSRADDHAAWSFAYRPTVATSPIPPRFSAAARCGGWTSLEPTRLDPHLEETHAMTVRSTLVVVASDLRSPP
jgi:hypothetical protein